MNFAVVNLGCKVNRVESDDAAARLALRGVETPEASADLIVVNTCTVTGEAEKKTRKAVRRALRANDHARVLVTGCAAAIDAAFYEALDERVAWGSIAGPTKQDKYNTYRAPVVKPSKKQLAAGAVAYELGQARPVEDAHALFESEYKQQYRSLPFWKRSVILVAGVAVNLLFAVLLFVVLFSLIGVDVQTSAGDIRHVNVNPLDAIRMGFMYIGMVVQLIAGLFNPSTAGEVVQNSTSVIGIAAMSKQAVDLGLASAISFVASISVSLGIMNLLPIPPLDGGRFVIEVFQKISRKVVTMRALNYLSAAGMILFIGFFLFMANQDIQRIISGAGFGG